MMRRRGTGRPRARSLAAASAAYGAPSGGRGARRRPSAVRYAASTMGGAAEARSSEARGRAARLLASEELLDATVPVAPRSRLSDPEAVARLNMALHQERRRRVETEEQLRDTEQLMALKLEDLKTVVRRIKRLEGENELQVQLEQESQKTFQFLGGQIADLKTARAEEIAVVRGQIARELEDVRLVSMAKIEEVASHMDRVLGWVDKSAEELATLRANLDSFTRRTNTGLETITTTVAQLRKEMNTLADTSKEDANSFKLKIAEVEAKTRELEGLADGSGGRGAAVRRDEFLHGGVTTTALDRSAATAAAHAVSLSDIRHQELQQTIAAVKRECSSSQSASQDRMDTVERMMAKLARRLETQVSDLTQSVNDERDWVKQMIGSLRRETREHIALVVAGNTEQKAFEKWSLDESAVGAGPPHEAIAELLDRVQTLESGKADVERAAAEALATARDTKSQLSALQAQHAAETESLQSQIRALTEQLRSAPTPRVVAHSTAASAIPPPLPAVARSGTWEADGHAASTGYGKSTQVEGSGARSFYLPRESAREAVAGGAPGRLGLGRSGHATFGNTSTSTRR